MPIVTDATRTVRRRYTENPRTVLAFYATVLGLALAAVIGLVATLASTHVMTDAIPWLIVFAGAIFVALVAGVFVVMLIDPSKLMLGQVTGHEYAEIQRLSLGDSRSGEREIPIAQAGPGAPVILAPVELGDGTRVALPSSDKNAPSEEE